MNSQPKLMAEDVLRRYAEEDLPEFVELKLNNVNQRGNFGNTPLHVAAVRGNLDEVDALLRAGAEVNAVGERGNSPLHEAALQGHASVVSALVVAGASLGLQNADGRTARELALKAGHKAVVDRLDRGVA